MENNIKMNISQYKKKSIEKNEKSIDEFRSHLITFAAVNCGLFMLNMMTSSGFPWFLFVLGGWGIGIASHWGNKYISALNLKDIESLDSMTDDEVEELIMFHKSRSAFYTHVISNTAVALYLIMINVITSPAFLWALIPTAAMAVGVASHWGQYTNKLRKNNFNGYIEPNTVINSQIEEAYKLKDSIVNTIMQIRKKFKNFAMDILPKIDDYVDTITLLSEKKSDLENTLDEISIDEINMEKESVLEKMNNTDSDILIAEYKKSMEESDNHINTIKKLKEQKELLQLKISTSISSLKQLNLELIGMRSKATYEDSSILDDFEKKSADLSIYYKDLLDSYDELHR